MSTSKPRFVHHSFHPPDPATQPPSYSASYLASRLDMDAIITIRKMLTLLSLLLIFRMLVFLFVHPR